MTITYAVGVALMAIGMVLFYVSPKFESLMLSSALAFIAAVLIGVGMILLTPFAFSPAGG